MSRRTVLAGLASAGLIWTLLSSSSPGGQSTPLKAMVVQGRVEMRAGAGRTFYCVGHLSRGTQVSVDEVVFGWYKIVPPAGTYSYVPKRALRLQGDGQVGQVIDQRIAVMSGALKGPTESYRRQIDLLEGDTVRILGEEGDYYKIAPPPGAFVFLPPDSLRPLTEAEATKRAWAVLDALPDSDPEQPPAVSSVAPAAEPNRSEAVAATPDPLPDRDLLLRQLEEALDHTRTESPTRTVVAELASDTTAIASASPADVEKEEAALIATPSVAHFVSAETPGWDRGLSPIATSETPTKEHKAASAGSPSSGKVPLSEPRGPSAPRGENRKAAPARSPASLAPPTAAIQPVATPAVPFSRPASSGSPPTRIEASADVGTPETPATPPTPEVPGTPEPAAPRSPGYSSNPSLSQPVRQAEWMMEQAEALPIDQQPIPQLLATYQALWDSGKLTPVERHIVASRLVQLQCNATVAGALAQIAAVKQEIESSRVQISDAKPALQDVTPQPSPDETGREPAVDYDVMGRLLASSVYDGQRLPRLYRIVDPTTQRTIAYAHGNGTINPATTVGQYVGIVGRSQFDRALRLNVIKVDRLDVLEYTPLN